MRNQKLTIEEKVDRLYEHVESLGRRVAELEGQRTAPGRDRSAAASTARPETILPRPGEPSSAKAPEGLPMAAKAPEGLPIAAKAPEGMPIAAKAPEGMPIAAKAPEGRQPPGSPTASPTR